jgi:hypothetical protein
MLEKKMEGTIMRSKVWLIILTPVILVGLLAVGWTWLTLHWDYAEGERTGYVQKLSKRGWICKTWEGEIVLVTMPGAIPEKFEFTVRDEAVVAKINAAAGKRVVLHYQQHKFIPVSCFGDTEYFIDNVREIADAVGTFPPPSVPQGALQQPR